MVGGKASEIVGFIGLVNLINGRWKSFRDSGIHWFSEFD